jgi:hypothetical protein
MLLADFPYAACVPPQIVEDEQGTDMEEDTNPTFITPVDPGRRAATSSWWHEVRQNSCQPAERKIAPINYTLMWGSDKLFGPDQYHPPPATASAIELEHDLQLSLARSIYSVISLPGEPADSDKNFEQVRQGPSLSSACPQDARQITGQTRRRLSHIIQERNKRHNQQFLFTTLSKLISTSPHDASLTRRQLLARIAAWVEQLIDGNERLKIQLMNLSCPYSCPS